MLLAEAQIFTIGHGFNQGVSNAGLLEKNTLDRRRDYFIRINPNKAFFAKVCTFARRLLDNTNSSLPCRDLQFAAHIGGDGGGSHVAICKISNHGQVLTRLSHTQCRELRRAFPLRRAISSLCTRLASIPFARL